MRAKITFSAKLLSLLLFAASAISLTASSVRTVSFCLLWLACLAAPAAAQTTPPSFRTQTLDSTELGSGLALGDVDGDGRPDVLATFQREVVWYRNGDWQRFVMAADLTEHDNVCLAARDINGDGLVEVAVGAQWNPGETSDPAISGSVHYLVRPDDPTKSWSPVTLPHEPTVHRMRWLPLSDGRYELIVLPLHGRGNVDGMGKGVRVMTYRPPSNPTAAWDTATINQEMHLTHNLDPLAEDSLLIAGKEGVVREVYQNARWATDPLPALVSPAGEVRRGHLAPDRPFITTIEPMHGQQLVVYKGDNYSERLVLNDDLQEGHALACVDLLGLGYDQILVGWRKPNRAGEVGIKLYVPVDEEGGGWMHHYIDQDGIACEDLRVADLDDDGDLDVVASGRDTRNLKIYWNQMIGNQGVSD